MARTEFDESIGTGRIDKSQSHYGSNCQLPLRQAIEIPPRGHIVDIESRIRELEISIGDYRQIAMRLEGMTYTRAQREAVLSLKEAPSEEAARAELDNVRQAFLSREDGWIGG